MRPPTAHLIIWILICVAAFSMHWFWYSIIADKSVKVADIQNQINAKTETASRIAFARTTLNEIADDEAIVQSYFVPETGIVSFIDDLEARARGQKTAMKVLSVSVSDVKKRPTITLSINISGTFDAVARTVGVIEYAPYDLSVSKLSFVKDGKNEWHADIEIIVGSMSPPSSTTKPL